MKLEGQGIRVINLFTDTTDIVSRLVQNFVFETNPSGECIVSEGDDQSLNWGCKATDD